MYKCNFESIFILNKLYIYLILFVVHTLNSKFVTFSPFNINNFIYMYIYILVCMYIYKYICIFVYNVYLFSFLRFFML